MLPVPPSGIAGLPPRPPNPFGGLGGFSLKQNSANRNAAYVDKQIAQIIGKRDKSATEFMRTIDDIKKHTPVESETANLNIPSDRLCIENLPDIMNLCGACVGVRFSSDEFDLMMSLKSEVASTSKTLTDAFNKLSPEMRKATGLDLSGSENIDLLAFFESADEFLKVAVRIQDLLRTKQALASPENRMVIGKDPDGLTGSLRPQWIDILTNKYIQYMTQLKGSQTIAPVTKGKLACFLGLCTGGRIRCDEKEKDAIFELLEASNDSTVQIYLHMPFDKIVSLLQTHSMEYWSNRFYVFLTSVTELKSLPSDQKSVQAVELFA